MPDVIEEVITSYQRAAETNRLLDLEYHPFVFAGPYRMRIVEVYDE
jgi:hypothetical protein